MRAAVYARVSSRQQRDKHTIASQLSACPAFAEGRGWQLVGAPYVDDGRSAGPGAGKLEAREAYQRLIADAAAGAFDVVVVIDLDRLTRTDDLRERGEILGLFQRHGVRIAEASTGLVHDLGTSVGDLLVTFRAWVASEERRKIVERTKRGHERAIADGRLPRGRAPYGLRFDVATGAWSVAPEAGVVREIFARAAAGESARAIGRDLEQRGVPTPRGGRWPRCVWRILRLSAYRGSWVCDKGTGRAIDVPALVDVETWHAAQETMRRGRLSQGRPAKSPQVIHDYLCLGLLTCGECGGRIWTHRESKSKIGGRLDGYYLCSNRRDPRAETRCALPSRRVRDVDARVWEAVVGIVEMPREALLRRLAGRRGATAEEDAAWAADVEGWEKRLERLVAVELELTGRYAEGLISAGAMDEQLRRLTGQRRTLQEQIDAARAARAALGASAAGLEAVAGVLADVRGKLPGATIAQRRELVRALVPEGFVLHADGRVTGTARPLGALARPWASGSLSPEKVTAPHGRKAPTFRIVA